MTYYFIAFDIIFDEEISLPDNDVVFIRSWGSLHISDSELLEGKFIII